MMDSSSFLFGVALGILLHTMYDWYINNKK